MKTSPLEELLDERANAGFGQLMTTNLHEIGDIPADDDKPQ